MKQDWKKAEKDIYLPKKKPEICNLPSYNYFAVQGQGNPNGEEFAANTGALYSLTYAIKMMPKKHPAPAGYFEYSVYPLEADWTMPEGTEFTGDNKDLLVYTLLIRQPDFVTPELAKWAIETTAKAKPELPIASVQFITQPPATTVQIMHVGPYDNEPESFAKMAEFCKQNNLKRIGKMHREIYLGDPRRTKPENLRTILRYPVEE